MKTSKNALKVLSCTFALFLLTNSTGFQQRSDELKLIEFSKKSATAIIGKLLDLEVIFSSVLEDEAFVNIDIQLFGEKQLKAKINYEKKTFYIRFTSGENDTPIRLMSWDLQIFHKLHSSLRQHFLTDRTQVVKSILKVLSLLENYPSNEFFVISSEQTNQSVISLCDKIGQRATGIYNIGFIPFTGNLITEEEWVGPCASGTCFGRCGPDCGWPPEWQIQQFTQDCFNHDLCSRKILALGWDKIWVFLPVGPCGDEWLFCVDDWILGADCNEISSEWTVEMRGTSCFGSDCAYISFDRLYYFQAGFNGDPFQFQGVYTNPIDGRIAVIEGILSSGNLITGSWNIPTYLGPECGRLPAGYASGSFIGQNNCGKITMDLYGTWGWYYLSNCTEAGYGDFYGSITASRNGFLSISKDSIEKTSNLKSRVSPCIMY